MRWLFAVLILLRVSSALAGSEPAQSKTQADPCWTASETSAKSTPPVWAAELHRRTAIYVTQHVRKACRIVSDAMGSGDEGLAQPLAQLRDEVLGPIYRAYPHLADAPLVDDSRRPRGAHATRKDIGRATAVRLEAALMKIRGEIGQSSTDKANQAANKDAAEAALQPFFNATVELYLASKVVFDAYPDLRAKELRSVSSQPRTADTDAESAQNRTSTWFGQAERVGTAAGKDVHAPSKTRVTSRRLDSLNFLGHQPKV